MDHLSKFLWIIAAGISGAFVGLTLHSEKRSPLQVFVFLMSGMLTAMWLTPIMARMFGLTDPEAISAMSFAVGAAWQSTAGQALDMLSKIRGGKPNA